MTDNRTNEPTEAQARAVRKLDNVQAILAGAQASVTDAVRELSLTSAALVAAQGAAPQLIGRLDLARHYWRSQGYDYDLHGQDGNNDYEMGMAVADAALAALAAAQGAAPRAESADCDRDGMGICKRCGMGLDAGKVLDGDFACPALPTSAVDEDTPTTDDVRLDYMAVRWSKNDTVSFEARAEFDRWLAEVEREAAEKAWWEACVRIADGESNLDIADTYQKQNPYLEEAPNE